MPCAIEEIAEKYRRGDWKYSDHAAVEQDDDGILDDELDFAIGQDSPKVIIPYEYSCLILGWSNDERPIHALLAFGTIDEVYDELVLVTVYRPDLSPHLWDAHYERRA